VHVSPWLIRQRLSSQVSRRLYCFPCAGGNPASYRAWQAKVDPAIEICAVQLPGRGTRLHEKPLTELGELVKSLSAEIARNGSIPFAFFGHSLGALIGFEVARYCRLAYLPTPAHLFVAACDPPQCRKPSKGLHALPDNTLLSELGEYNGTPPDILADKELMALMLPTIRADFALVENYCYRPAPPLTLPITVLASHGDMHVDHNRVGAWRQETTRECRVCWFDGDHFFVQTQSDAVVDLVSAEFAETLCA
jgi:surfactin synthase thioesterase subunit